MKKIFLIPIFCLIIAGCRTGRDPSCKPWHISPSHNQAQEFYVLIPFDTACAIKVGMTETQLKELVGGVITTTTAMPSCPFFVAERSDGVSFEIAVMMSADAFGVYQFTRRYGGVSFEIAVMMSADSRNLDAVKNSTDRIVLEVSFKKKEAPNPPSERTR